MPRHNTLLHQYLVAQQKQQQQQQQQPPPPPQKLSGKIRQRPDDDDDDDYGGAGAAHQQQDETQDAAATTHQQNSMNAAPPEKQQQQQNFFSIAVWKQRLRDDVHHANENKSALTQSETSKQLLHTYNRIKDSAQTLMGLLAMQRGGVPLREIYAEFGIDLNAE